MIGEHRKLLIFGSCSPRQGSNRLSFMEKSFRPKYISTNTNTDISISSTYKISQFELELNSCFTKYFSKTKNIIFLNPAKVFCNNGLCIENNNSEIYFSDDSHLSRDGSLKAVNYFKDKLLEVIEEN